MMYPKIVRIHKVIAENKDIKTIVFPYVEDAKPGQFFMILIPGIDEIPMSVSYISKEYQGFTFRRVGDATAELFSKKAGDIIGIRGPLGNGFDLRGEHLLFIGGGTGISAIAPAVEKAVSQGKQATVILGAKTRDELFFVDRLKNVADVNISTDDGSIGYHGFASDLAEEMIRDRLFDLVITCGPELMMKKVVDVCNNRNIEVQASLERYIKCGMGICGQCTICNGLRVCKDGPVFDGKTLSKCKDFGYFKRDASGRKINIQ